MKTCGKCGSKIEKPGPCPVCDDKPFGQPKNPTTGWMRSELERRGVDNRGTPMSDDQLKRLLREVGVDIADAKEKKPSDKGDR
jgi:hypothetical protein